MAMLARWRTDHGFSIRSDEGDHGGRGPDRPLLGGRLREDLFYRLNVITIELPPLRERIEDLPVLVAHFIRQANQDHRGRVEGVSAECLEVLKCHRWPGNVRELRSAILHAMTMSKTISLEDLPPHLRSSNGEVEHVTFPVGSRLDDVERELISRTIEPTAGNKTLAARMLGLGLRTLYRRLERYAGCRDGESPTRRATPKT